MLKRHLDQCFAIREKVLVELFLPEIAGKHQLYGSKISFQDHDDGGYHDVLGYHDEGGDHDDGGELNIGARSRTLPRLLLLAQTNLPTPMRCNTYAIPSPM